jgi:hypothetical protein
MTPKSLENVRCGTSDRSFDAIAGNAAESSDARGASETRRVGSPDRAPMSGVATQPSQVGTQPTTRPRARAARQARTRGRRLRRVARLVGVDWTQAPALAILAVLALAAVAHPGRRGWT